MKERQFLAFDMGAGSGRAILGCFDGRKLTLTETHCFQNSPAVLAGSLYWDILMLYGELQSGVRKTV